MIHELEAFLASPVLHSACKGAILGVLIAARIDYAAFKTFQSWRVFEDYSWSVASWRWFQGAIIGAAGAIAVTLGLSFVP